MISTAVFETNVKPKSNTTLTGEMAKKKKRKRKKRLSYRLIFSSFTS